MTSHWADDPSQEAAGTRSENRQGRTGRARRGGRPLSSTSGASTVTAVLAGLPLLLLLVARSAKTSSLADQLSSENTPSPSLAAASLQNLSSPQPAFHHNLSHSDPADYVCQPIGPCQPCPIDQLTNPVCKIYHNRRLVDCIYLGSSSPALIASILRDPSTYATGLMNHHTWIDPLSETDSSSTPPRPSTTTPTTTTTTTTTTSTSNEREAQTENSQEGLAARATDQPQDQSHQDEMGAGLAGAEFQTWEACERVVLKEQQDFYEFALCNLAIAAISLIVYGFRTKQLVIKQYGKLAARIGIPPS